MADSSTLTPASYLEVRPLGSENSLSLTNIIYLGSCFGASHSRSYPRYAVIRDARRSCFLWKAISVIVSCPMQSWYIRRRWNHNCSNTQKKGMLSSVHAGYAMVPLTMISGDEKRSEIRQKIMKERESASTSTKKLYELQAKWLEDPNQAQLE